MKVKETPWNKTLLLALLNHIPKIEPQDEFQSPGWQQFTFVYSTHKDYSWNAERSLKSCKTGQSFTSMLNKKPI